MNNSLVMFFVLASLVMTTMSYRFVGGGVITIDRDGNHVEDYGRTARFVALAVAMSIVGVCIGSGFDYMGAASWWKVALCFVVPPLGMHLLWRTGEIGHLYMRPMQRLPTTAYGKWLADLGVDDGLLVRTAVQAAVTTVLVFATVFITGLVKPTVPFYIVSLAVTNVAFFVIAGVYDHGDGETFYNTSGKRVETVDVDRAETWTGAALALVATTLSVGLLVFS